MVVVASLGIVDDGSSSYETAAMRPSRRATEPRRPGAPVPSTMSGVVDQVVEHCGGLTQGCAKSVGNRNSRF